MKPDFERAAIKAAETIINNGIISAPVAPLPILKKTPGVLVLSFAEMSESVGVERRKLISLFGERQDAVTSVQIDDKKLKYVVAYNQRLPFYMLQRGIARELGHITEGACAKLVKIPRVFLKAALTQMVEIAKSEGISVIDEAALAIINDKRRQEKKK